MSNTSHATIPQSLLGKIQFLQKIQQPSGGTSVTGLLVHRKSDFGFAKDLLYKSIMKIGMSITQKQDNRLSWLNTPTYYSGQSAYGMLVKGDSNESPFTIDLFTNFLAQNRTTENLLVTQTNIQPKDTWWINQQTMYISGGTYETDLNQNEYEFIISNNKNEMYISFKNLINMWFSPMQYFKDNEKTIFIGGYYEHGWTNKDYSFLSSVSTTANYQVDAVVSKILASDTYDYNLEDGGISNVINIVFQNNISSNDASGIVEEEITLKRNAWFKIKLVTTKNILSYSTLPANMIFDLSQNILMGYCIEENLSPVVFTLEDDNEFILHLKTYLIERSSI